MGVKSAVKGAGKAVMEAVGSASEDKQDRDLLDTLKKEHDEVMDLLAELQKAETAAQRKSLVMKIKSALVPHTKAEEKVLYDAILALKDKEAQTDGHEGYLEHEWASKTLQQLGAIANATSPEHKATGKVLKELVEHHIREEESNVWRDAREHFPDEERIRMNAKYLSAKQRIKG